MYSTVQCSAVHCSLAVLPHWTDRYSRCVDFSVCHISLSLCVLLCLIAVSVVVWCLLHLLHLLLVGLPEHFRYDGLRLHVFDRTAVVARQLANRQLAVARTQLHYTLVEAALGQPVEQVGHSLQLLSGQHDGS